MPDLSPRVSDLVGLEWDREFAFLASVQVISKLLVGGPSFENHCSKRAGIPHSPSPHSPLIPHLLRGRELEAGPIQGGGSQTLIVEGREQGEGMGVVR